MGSLFLKFSKVHVCSLNKHQRLWIPLTSIQPVVSGLRRVGGRRAGRRRTYALKVVPVDSKDRDNVSVPAEGRMAEDLDLGYETPDGRLVIVLAIWQEKFRF